MTGRRSVPRAMLAGLRLRCPDCGTGRMFPRWSVTPYEACPHCGYHHAYAPGEWSGAVMIAQMLMGLAVIPVFIALSLWTDLSFTARVLWTGGIVVGLWVLGYRRIKGVWFGWLYAAHALGADDGVGGRPEER